MKPMRSCWELQKKPGDPQVWIFPSELFILVVCESFCCLRTEILHSLLLRFFLTKDSGKRRKSDAKENWGNRIKTRTENHELQHSKQFHSHDGEESDWSFKFPSCFVPVSHDTQCQPEITGFYFTSHCFPQYTAGRQAELSLTQK